MACILGNPLRLIFAIIFLVGCGRSLGPDSDGDGLTDRQEEQFGTDPTNPDTDCDNEPDGTDEMPKQGASLNLTNSPVTDEQGGLRCSNLEARLTFSGSDSPPDGKVELATDLGEIGPVEETEPGVFRARLCTDVPEVAYVSAKYDDPDDSCPAVTTGIVVVFAPRGVLPRPGLNTEPYSGAGRLDGTLTVFSLDADHVGMPFGGAFVLVESDSGTWNGLTNSQGWVEIPSLKGPVDVTVTAEGFRTTTYIGMDSRYLAVAMVRLDPIPGQDDGRTGSIEGVVSGFMGEGNLPPFPPMGNPYSLVCDEDSDDIPLVIVQVALRNIPLSSISMGSILESPDPDETGIPPIPSNLVLLYENAPDDARFKLDDLPEGQHLLFALGGTGRCLYDAMKDPYNMPFRPRAMGIRRIQVKGGEVVNGDVTMDVDLLPEANSTVDVEMGAFPDDWKTGERLPKGLVFGVVDTGGEGYIFVAVDGSYNLPGFENPVRMRFPSSHDPRMKDLDLTGTTNLVVGFAGRGVQCGADPPGITTAIVPGVVAGDKADFSVPEAWLPPPEPLIPKPPQETGIPLDEVSEEPFEGLVEWAPVTDPRPVDLYAVRINYMTPAPRNPLVELGECKAAKGSVGGPRSHCVWELMVPGDRTNIDLPAFPYDAPAGPVLKNPVSNLGDDTDPQEYGPDTMEIEVNAYVLGAGGKPFDYYDDFEYTDVNLHATGVSQDSYLVDFSAYQ